MLYWRKREPGLSGFRDANARPPGVRTRDSVVAAARQPPWRRSIRLVLPLSCLTANLAAQDLQPRAYIPAPVGLNYFGFSYSNSRGGQLFDPSLPIEDTQVNASAASISFGQTLGVAGRTVQVLAVVPYVVANLTGTVSEADRFSYRSGLGDAVFRYAMNIHGAPAMDLKTYAGYRQKTIIGASITVSAPTGQYDANRVVNIGANRWAFKSELGVSRAAGKWILEGAAGVWLFTPNNRYLGGSQRTQDPMGSLQVHVVRTLPHRMWIAADWTFYTGGRSQINGQDRPDYLGNTRWGATFGIAVTPRQGIKVSYFKGVRTRVGSDIGSLGISYNLIWLKGR